MFVYCFTLIGFVSICYVDYVIIVVITGGCCSSVGALITHPPVGERNFVMSVSVCLSVRMQEPLVQSSQMLPVVCFGPPVLAALRYAGKCVPWSLIDDLTFYDPVPYSVRVQ